MNYNRAMKEKVNKIKRIIDNDFDNRMEVALFNYIFEKGTMFLSRITDEEIENEIKEDLGIFGKDFLIAMVKTASRLSKEFEIIDLMTYVRMELWMTPSITETYAYRNDNGLWEIENSSRLDLDELESDSVTVHVIIEEED